MSFYAIILCCFLIVVKTYSVNITFYKSVSPSTSRKTNISEPVSDHTACQCHSLGVNKKLDPCRNFSGQCPCLPNVTGKLCDKCEKNHFGIRSGIGCQPCDCAPNGSNSAPCNEVDGRCDCKNGFGGRRCDEYQNWFWCNPLEKCFECRCNILGTNKVIGIACNIITGQCPCLPHVIGQTCDRCEENNFNFASGTGCKPCDCDPVGSNSEPCNEFSGQCHCKSGFSGHRCDVSLDISTNRRIVELLDEDYEEDSGFTTEEITTTTSDNANVSTVVSHETPTIIYRTFDGNITLLDCIDGLADKVAPNTHHEDKNLAYTSYMTNVPGNSTNITWQDKTINGPEISILKYAINQLVDSSIKMVVFEEKIKSQLIGDIVVIKTKTIEESFDEEAALQLKFEREKIFYPDNTNWTCVYWDFNISKWSVQGIITKFEPDYINCLSFHLSTFSILLPDPDKILFNQRYEQESQHKVWLTNISRIGSWITICFLILVIVINCRKKTGNETRKILINSSVALLVTHGAYQIHTFFEGYSKCLIINVMKYYFVLAFLLWTAADGINMWRILLADVFNTKGHIFYRWYKIIAWGTPMITTSVGIFFFTSQGVCKLQFNKTYDLIFYLVPCTVIICCNMLLFIWMFLNMTIKDTLGKLKDKKIDYVLALTQVFGIGWCVVFPFLYLKSTQLLAEYLLAGVISTQGLLIFIVRGGIDKNLKKKLQNRSSIVSTWFSTKILKSSTGAASRKPQKNISTVELDLITRSNSETN